MASSETLLKAIFKRLKTRLDKNFTSSLYEAASFIKDSPSGIKKEWDLFQKEIVDEAERINAIENEQKNLTKNLFKKDASFTVQSKINQIRKEIVNLTNQIEEIN